MVIESIIDKNKPTKLDLSLEDDTKHLVKGFENNVTRAIDKIAGLVIRALPLPDFAKDILRDIKDTLKRGDIKQIFGTVVNSSIREGLEMLGLSRREIRGIYKLKDIALKGGLVVNLKGALDIIEKDYIDKNLLGNNTYEFFEKLKQFVVSGEFVKKLEIVINNFEQRKQNFMDQINVCKSCYNKGDIDGTVKMISNLRRKNEIIKQYPECAREISIFENIVKMSNNKNEKLSPMQLQLCNVL